MDGTAETGIVGQAQDHAGVISSVVAGILLFCSRFWRRPAAKGPEDCVDVQARADAHAAREEVLGLRHDLMATRLAAARTDGSVAAMSNEVKRLADEQARGTRLLFKMAGRLDVSTDD